MPAGALGAEARPNQSSRAGWSGGVGSPAGTEACSNTSGATPGVAARRASAPNAPAGMGDLLLVRDALAGAFARRPFELVICSDSRERFEALVGALPAPARFVPWTQSSFAAELAHADAVLIPLSDNPFVAAKTHNRLSLALSAGVPVVADHLDSYDEFAPFAFIGDWPAGLEAVLMRPAEARARASAAMAYLEAHWSAAAVAPQWEAALGLSGETSRRRLEAGPLLPVPHLMDWFASHGRARRPWLLAAGNADPAVVERARGEGLMVMSLGAAGAFAADLAYVLDAEALADHGTEIASRAAYVLVPADLHVGGWAGGRSLASWEADLPALRRLREEGRLVRFDLWTGSPEGAPGDFEGAEVPLRLLGQAGVREVSAVGGVPGLVMVAPSCPGAVGPLLDWCLEAHDGPSFLRMASLPAEIVWDAPAGWRPEPGRGFEIAQGADAVLIGSGPILLAQAVKASRALAERGIGLAVVDMPWLNRVDDDWLAGVARGRRLVVTLDDHYLEGGQGEKLLAALARAGVAVPTLQLGLSAVPPSGQPGEVLQRVGLDAAGIAEAIAARLG